MEARARKIAVVMGAVPHQKVDRRLNVVGRAILDNAEVANRDFGRN
jgi:hypothetical protein